MNDSSNEPKGLEGLTVNPKITEFLTHLGSGLITLNNAIAEHFKETINSNGTWRIKHEQRAKRLERFKAD